ncbi:Flp family type IVb pilin [Geopseudomonas guangdongensis]|uniref:Pilus assembly protein Flp/PilA n=1 Tax=Geopseudomonas guangdongensis TaxID=1245526 RepID=A0A1H2GKL5_9GAMM|nr:Flp family type IVb pilin [Pseudomonas guangdongensis]SDU19991.1 pilus assembly protein Flp/PilA [Pseudomonas guangdongensis]
MDIQKFKVAVVKFAKDEEGLTIVEYAVAGGLITGAVVLAFTNLGAAVRAKINVIISALGGTAG